MGVFQRLLTQIYENVLKSLNYFSLYGEGLLPKGLLRYSSSFLFSIINVIPVTECPSKSDYCVKLSDKTADTSV